MNRIFEILVPLVLIFILLISLLFPILIYLFLRFFGNNKYELPLIDLNKNDCIEIFQNDSISDNYYSGFIKIVDRKKDMIIVSGFNVYPNEIEEIAMMNDKIFEAGCIGVKDGDGNENVKLFISKVPGKNLNTEEVIDYCKKYLTGYKIPKFVEFIDEIPKSNVGKILRRKLRDIENG